MKLKLFVLLLLIIIVVMPSDAQTPGTSHMPPVNQALPHISNHLNVTTNLPVKKSMPAVSEARIQDYFPLSEAVIYTDTKEYKVVNITANMLADDIERVTGKHPRVVKTTSLKNIPKGGAVAVTFLPTSKVKQKTVFFRNLNKQILYYYEFIKQIHRHHWHTYHDDNALQGTEVGTFGRHPSNGMEHMEQVSR